MTSTAGLGLANLLVAGAGFRPPPTSCGRAIWSYERRPSTATTSSGSSRLGATFAWRSIRSFHLLPDRGRAGATGRAERVHRSDDDRLPYSSAHIDGVESGLFVHPDHSTQGRPETIEEVRRILRLHAGLR
jgi:hypothetical protein